VLIACILSLRTQDTTTGPAAARLFALADTPRPMLALTPRQIERAIYPVGFYRTKARVIRRICAALLERFGGRVPDTIDELLTLDGVGRKTANLVVTLGFNKPGICVDTHVHRISNRPRLRADPHPRRDGDGAARDAPRRYWIGYNDLLVTVRSERLRADLAQMLDLPRPGAVPARGRHHVPLGVSWRTAAHSTAISQ
jgi:endonuclease-3